MGYVIDLWRFHVQDFSDSSLHDKEVWIVDVELDGPEEILDARVICCHSIDHVLVPASNYDLSGDRQFIEALVAQRALLFVAVVERYGHCGSSDACLSTLVHQLL